MTENGRQFCHESEVVRANFQSRCELLCRLGPVISRDVEIGQLEDHFSRLRLAGEVFEERRLGRFAVVSSADGDVKGSIENILFKSPAPRGLQDVEGEQAIAVIQKV